VDDAPRPGQLVLQRSECFLVIEILYYLHNKSISVSRVAGAYTGWHRLDTSLILLFELPEKLSEVIFRFDSESNLSAISRNSGAGGLTLSRPSGRWEHKGKFVTKRVTKALKPGIPGTKGKPAASTIPEKRIDPSNQLARGDRLGHVIIRARLQAFHCLGNFGASCK
jgi:hypothetical protein